MKGLLYKNKQSHTPPIWAIGFTEENDHWFHSDRIKLLAGCREDHEKGRYTLLNFEVSSYNHQTLLDFNSHRVRSPNVGLFYAVGSSISM